MGAKRRACHGRARLVDIQSQRGSAPARSAPLDSIRLRPVDGPANSHSFYQSSSQCEVSSMSSSRITEIINPSRLRLGIKRAFTGTVNEVIGELLQNSFRAGARTIRITTDDRGFIYHDDGRGLLNEDDFEALIKLGESGWDHRVETEQQPMGLGFTVLLAQEEVESVTFSSNLLALTLNAKRWWED